MGVVMVKNCPECGEQFKQTNNRHIYCSKKCSLTKFTTARGYITPYHKRVKKQRLEKTKERECSTCGESLYGRSLLTRYCSKECKEIARRPPVIQYYRYCNHCNKPFETGVNTDKKYCDTICYKRRQRKIEAESQGRTDFAPRGGCSIKAMEKLVVQNAKQAWRYHLKEKVSREWLDNYYSILNKPWQNPRLSKAERYKLRYRHDEAYQLKEKMRRQVNKAKKRSGVADLMRGAINRDGKSNQVEQLLGYTIDELRTHLEKQFTKGMTWEAFKRGDIHIDHITPQASFNLQDDKEWQACWCLSNLQPLWAKDNLSKSNKLVHLL